MAPSLPLLRSWRSTIYAPNRESASANVVNTRAIESPASINHRLSQQQAQQQEHYENSVTELRRRLARKASTFSLRGKNRRSQKYLRELVKAEEKVKDTEQEVEESETSSVVIVTREGERRCIQVKTEVTESPSPALPSLEILPTFAARFRNKNAPHPLRSHTSVSMASETSPPPVPFARLQKIATEVCALFPVFQ
jgi:hypothetical protein